MAYYVHRDQSYPEFSKWLLSPLDQKTFQELSERSGLRAIFWERRESEDTHEKSIFLLFRQNIPLGELIQGKIV